MPNPLERLEAAREETLAAEGVEFLRRFAEYASLFESDETIRAAVDELRQEVVDAEGKLDREDPEFVARLIPIRQQLIAEEPGVDDSDRPWPGPYEGLNPESARAFHDWEYTLANFDAIAADRDEIVKVATGADQLNTSRTQMLASILKAKLHDLVFDFNEKKAPRPDLMPLYDEVREIEREQTNAYRRAERIADQNGIFSLVWLEEVAASLQFQEVQSLRSPKDMHRVLEQALKKPDLYRLYEVTRPKVARGPLSDAEKEAVERTEVNTREEMERFYRPLRKRIEQREAAATPKTQKRRRLPTLFGRIRWVPPVLGFIADVGGTAAVILAALKLFGVI